MRATTNEQMNRAEQAFHQGDLANAERLCRNILAELPDTAPAVLLLGLIQVRSGHTAEAISTIQKALDLSPNDYIGMAWLQLAYRRELRYQEAVAVGTKARALWPRDVDVLVNLSHAFLGCREIASAAECLTEALKVQPRNGALYRRLGIAHELLGQDQEAAESFEMAIRYLPTDDEGYARLGRLLINHGNFTQALDLTRRALKLCPRSAQINLIRAQALKSLREDAAAYEALDTAIKLDPAMEISAAMWLQEDGRFDEAARLFQQAIDRQPEQGVAYYGLVKGRKVKPEDQPLLDRMESLLDQPKLPPTEKAALHYGLGKSYDNLGRYEQAMAHFDIGNNLNFAIHLAGRAINPADLERERKRIERAFDAESIERYADVGSVETVPIFIVGMIRSGTTLVEQILCSHPKVGGAGEQRFWVNELPRAVDLDQGELDRSAFIELRQRYMAVLRSFQPDSERITDKMPMNFYCAGLLHLAFPNSPIIHVQRHPIDTALSIWMTDLAKPPEFAHSKANIVAEYRDYLAIMDHWRKVIPPNRLLDVRYEDLVADQETWTRRMLDFCGLEFDSSCLAFYANDRAVSTPSAWQVRQPMYRSSVERWKRYEPWLGDFTELSSDAAERDY